MRVAIVASEVVPFSKTGGLADVAGALPSALSKLGEDVLVITPLYAEARKNCERLNLELKECGNGAVRFPIGGAEAEGRILMSSLPGSNVPVYLLENDRYYGRPGLYSNPDDNSDYGDNSERFIFLARGALEACKALGIQPDVLHCNDWQTGLIPAHLHHLYQNDFPKTASVMTVHNIAYQGLFWHGDMNLTGLPWELFNWRMLEYYGKLSFLKAGLVAAEVVTTVSKQYAKEIQTEQFGMGMEGVLRDRGDTLVGIVNGVDYSVWSPEVDKAIAASYSAEDLSGKAKCKRALQARLRLPVKKEVPVIGMIGRLVEQKGLDLVAAAMDRLMEMGLQLVILGTGQPKYHSLLTEMQTKYPDRIGLFLGFDDVLAHQIEAGSDIFLMPSRFEPCGLNQLYSLRYGTVPIVSQTGGLVDTIVDYSKATAKAGTATGFTFRAGSMNQMRRAIGRAVQLYHEAPDAWRALQSSGMRQDWSWERSAREYIQVYKMALEGARKK
jgi:starch synthase